MKFYRIFSIAFLLIVTLCSFDSPNNNKQEDKNFDQKKNKPLNIIYIMADDHAYQAISAYGSQISKLAPTPNIDRIANEGARMSCLLHKLNMRT